MKDNFHIVVIMLSLLIMYFRGIFTSRSSAKLTLGWGRIAPGGKKKGPRRGGGGRYVFPVLHSFGNRSAFVVLLLYEGMWYSIHFTACRGGRLLKCEVKIENFVEPTRYVDI